MIIFASAELSDALTEVRAAVERLPGRPIVILEGMTRLEFMRAGKRGLCCTRSELGAVGKHWPRARFAALVRLRLSDFLGGGEGDIGLMEEADGA